MILTTLFMMTIMHCLNFEDCVQTHFSGQVMCTLYFHVLPSLALTAVSSIALTYKQYGSESDLTIALVHQECGCHWYCNKYNVNIPAWNAQLAYHIINHVAFQANASVQVDAADTFGILVTNGEFTAFVDPKFGTQV